MGGRRAAAGGVRGERAGEREGRGETSPPFVKGRGVVCVCVCAGRGGREKGRIGD